MSQKQKGGKSPNVSTGPSAALELVGKGGAKGDAATKLEEIDIQQLTALSGPINKRINALKNEQLKLLELEAKFYEELHELECKYARLYDPIYEKRRQIVIGDYEPTEDESKWALDEAPSETAATKNGEEPAAPATPTKTPEADESKLTESGKKLLDDLKKQFSVAVKKAEDEKGIPNFWLETLQSMRVTSEMIQEHDEPVLSHLVDVRVKYFTEKPHGYTLEFEFNENPYFTNKVLTKTYYLKTEIDAKDPFSFEGPDLDKALGCKIDWKAGKNVTVKLIKKKLKPRNKKAVPKVVTKEEKQESFFTFFDTPKPVDNKSGADKEKSEGADANKQVAIKSKNHPDDDEDDEGEEDDQVEAHFMLMADFETGQYIKDKIIPKAVLYYAGELDDADEDDDDYDGEYDDEDELDDDDDEDEENEDEDEEEDDDDDDEDDDDDGKGGKKALHKGGNKKHGGHGHGHSHKPGAKCGGGKPGEPTPSECKQN